MKLSIAGARDEAELKSFFEGFPIHNLVEYRLLRPNDFFSLYHAQGEESRTYLLRSREGQEISACATFVVRETLLDGKVQRIANATDLRVAPSRKATLSWGQHFLPVLEEVKKELRVDYVFSAIPLSDVTALNTFVRPRNVRRPMPRYYLYRKFNLVGLHGHFPFAPPPLKSLRIRQGGPATREALVAYIAKRASFRPFASAWDQASLEKKFSRLPNFGWENFLLAFDSDEQVVGCLATWDGSGLQQWQPVSFSDLRAHNFRQFVKFASYLGWTRAITKPLASTGELQPLNFRFLTFLHADNEDIFASLAQVAFESANKNQFLVYSHCDVDYRLRPPRGWVSSAVPYALYAVLSPETPPPDFLHPGQAPNPEVEAYLL